MKLLCWNCQGLGNLLTVQALKALSAKEKPDLLFLMETKNWELVLNILQHTLHYNRSFVQNPVDTVGGLAVFWNDTISLEIEGFSEDYFDMVCRDLSDDRLMRITCLHAPFSYHNRQLFWETLRIISTFNTLPWICAGHFNEILHPWEKVGRRSPLRSRLTSFRDVVDDCALMEVESKGCAYTWTNRREGADLIKE